VRTRWCTDSREEWIAELERQQREIERLREETDRADRAERERDALRRDLERVRRENERLRKELDLARRAGKRQAAPFSKNRPSPAPGRAGRKPGAAYGRRACRPAPTAIDEEYDAPLPATCPTCAGAVIETDVAMQYHEDLPPVRPIVRAFRVHIGTCVKCGRRMQGRHRLQTSDALGAAAAQLGPQAVATAAHLHKEGGLPLGKIACFYQQQFGLTVTPGGLVQALHRAARQAAPTYTALLDTVRQSTVVTPDETGWRVGAELHWLWVAATPSTTVYAIHSGRGFAEAATLLGADFAGTLVRDGWAPYRQFEQAAHQSCVNHLLHRARELQTDHPRALLPYQVQDVFQRALTLRDRHVAGEVSDHGLAVARGHLETRLSAILDQRSTVPAVRRFAAHLNREWYALFSFLHDPTIPATNWRAEQAIRPAVVTRKVCGGNRTSRGAQTQQILMTVFRTSRQRALDPLRVLADLLRERVPRIAAALFPT
jgi:transposase